jgi:hypothetical protein
MLTYHCLCSNDLDTEKEEYENDFEKEYEDDFEIEPTSKNMDCCNYSSFSVSRSFEHKQ